MSEKAPVTESKPAAAEVPTPPTPPRRSPGHRGQDVRDTVAEMAARAHEISLEAGSKMAAAMKDVINAAAGLTGFAVESARDLVQYMVRRGQMTQDEADKLIREAEEAHGKRNPGAVTSRSSAATADHASPRQAPKVVVKQPTPITPLKPVVPAAAKPPVSKAPAVKAAAPKKVATAAKKPAPTKGAVKRPAVAKASAKPAKKK
jgi:polyhydroxyalkanoate synthesis regulator phasin